MTALEPRQWWPVAPPVYQQFSLQQIQCRSSRTKRLCQSPSWWPLGRPFSSFCICKSVDVGIMAGTDGASFSAMRPFHSWKRRLETSRLSSRTPFERTGAKGGAQSGIWICACAGDDRSAMRGSTPGLPSAELESATAARDSEQERESEQSVWGQATAALELLYSKKFSSTKNFVKSDRQAVRQEFIFVKRRVALVCGRSVRLLIVYLHIHDYF